ncbi:sulfatase-like hydrolase/transferase [Sphingomonas sp. CL5.1]|uniref:sulfatase family protein n=1 Tax=Sphingomonas sp. CL5.1 TaxID=2653203 RepID=UPI0015820C87|nr:sulfatase-like hydrolase/transferase [Sphingomonas sp. CL5.1]QKS00489.1 sulfatase-like hydrolase/transferase [Sphingomonas sp. CL5.1]
MGAAAALSSCSAAGAQSAANAPRRPADRPNIIVIVADDLGYGDLSAYGGRIPTPNIDALARSGIRYDTAYATAPVCSPSRAGLLSGRFQGRFGFYYLLVGRQAGMPANETTIAKVARQANYRTAMVGKWHVGEAPGMAPLDQGFDSFYGFLGGATNYFPDSTKGLIYADTGPDRLVTRTKFPILDGRTIVDPPGNITDVFTDKAIQVIDQKSDRPFFLYLAYNAPHMPLEATPEEVKPFAADPSIYSRVYKAMVTTLDKGVGRVVSEVRRQGLEKNTLILFVSDNGCPNYDRGACSNKPLSGWKAFPLEGGDRVPFMMSWPGHIKAGQVSHEMVSTLDFMPTIAAATHQPVPAGSEGHSLFAPRPATARPLYWRQGPNHWLREGPWKLVTVNKTDKTESLSDVLGKPILSGLPGGVSPLGQWNMLFNLDRDPGEHHDVAAQHPEIVARLQDLFERWNRSNIDPAFPSRREYRTEIDGKKVQLVF